jgi:hypothetical protein
MVQGVFGIRDCFKLFIETDLVAFDGKTEDFISGKLLRVGTEPQKETIIAAIGFVYASRNNNLNDLVMWNQANGHPGVTVVGNILYLTP